MLRAIRRELRRSRSFIFSVAFITSGALALLKQALIEFEGAGTIITSTYLGFNAPEAFAELLSLDGITTYVNESPAGFHAKGYVFNQGAHTTAIIGSANLTANALVKNQEWNLQFSALPEGDIVDQLRAATARQVEASVPLTVAWIERYRETYVLQQPRVIRETVGVVSASLGETLHGSGRVVPNSMQLEALEAIAQVREAGENRAIVVSATGTGKTILSALDVRAAAPRKMLFVVHREQILDAAIQAYQQVLGEPASEFGKLAGGQRQLDRKYVFATIQMLSRADVLDQIHAEEFDYILVDEVHRAGADTYRQVFDRLRPTFLLGVTATPERTDGFNIYEMFDYNVPYEIRLQKALEVDMLAPFHYYGVTDYIDSDGVTVDDVTSFSKLVTSERVDHIIKSLERYGHAEGVRGLLFCSRLEEASELSKLLNERAVHGAPLRTVSLSGKDTVPFRESTITRLEAGELDYILTVDVFNEGIDIPTLNQIVMLRQTQSSIIFTQQLGRGLRKASGKDHVRVIDFIGNYANNYLIPIALTGDSSLNKDVVRRKLVDADTAGVVSGISSINFDRISRERVLRSLESIKLDSMKNFKNAYLDLHQRLGRAPDLLDYARFDTVDPVTLARKNKNYWNFLLKMGAVSEAPDPDQAALLNFVTAELLNGKRPHELLLLKWLISAGELPRTEYAAKLVAAGCTVKEDTIRSVDRIVSLRFFTEGERATYGGLPFVEVTPGSYKLAPKVDELLKASAFLHGQVDDAIETGLYLARHRNNWTAELQVGAMYSRKDVCRMLNWRANEYSTIYGYKVDRESQSCPIFVTYHKDDDVSESTQYEDELLDHSTLRWFTRSRRTLQSAEVRAIVAQEVPLHLFVKKDDAEGLDFYYLGQAESRSALQETMPGKDGASLDVVTMNLHLESPINESLYDYLVTGSKPAII
ncbi:DEAD/DEAH box helicase [Leucobacter salsicius]|uniref:DEAD/DEAH box helicase n=1 Tax=Leucobacter salsicius TaxID=664638 RepID=UPI001E3DAE9C|nr:DEAD/DEAH box helicase [Leucobacter salsicius]